MSENSNVDFFTNLDWTKSTEELLVSWADISLCYTWIFDKSYRSYNHINYRFTIPIVILSTITGTLSMSLNTIVPESSLLTGQFVIGGVNIFIGILSTLQNFFRYAQQSELHLAATRDWAKLHRNIKIELSIERKYRKPAEYFVRYARQEYERLLNTRPVIPTKIMDNFKRLYKNSDVIKPETLEKIRHLILDDDRNMIVNNPQTQINQSFINKITSFIKRSPSVFQPSTPNVSLTNTPSEPFTPNTSKNDLNINTPSRNSHSPELINNQLFNIKLDVLDEDDDIKEINIREEV